MTPGSFEDNDRLRGEIAKLIKRDLEYKILFARVEHLCDVADQLRVGLTSGQVRKALAG